MPSFLEPEALADFLRRGSASALIITHISTPQLHEFLGFFNSIEPTLEVAFGPPARFAEKDA